MIAVKLFVEVFVLLPLFVATLGLCFASLSVLLTAPPFWVACLGAGFICARETRSVGLLRNWKLPFLVTTLVLVKFTGMTLAPQFGAVHYVDAILGPLFFLRGNFLLALR
jgi:hypothetical protein